MQMCSHCHHRFAWKVIYLSFWKGWSYRAITCENCGFKHQITLAGRLTVYAFTSLPFLIFLFYLSPFENNNLNFLAGLGIALLGSFLTPFFVKFHIDKGS